jgi:hypothetical protein
MNEKALLTKAYDILGRELNDHHIYIKNLETALAAIQEAIDLCKKSAEVPGF